MRPFVPCSTEAALAAREALRHEGPMNTVLFDMDGLLIDSEPLWRACERVAFARYGLVLTEDDCRTTAGMRIDAVAAHWQRLRGYEGDAARVSEEIVDAMEVALRTRAVAMPGALALVHLARAAGYKTAIATSSPLRLAHAVVERFGWQPSFDAVCSAEKLEHGKPHPEIFLSAARALKVAPSSCVVFEDSLNGVIAAKAASMFCVAVPEHATPRFALADVQLTSLLEVEESRLASFFRRA